MRKFHPYLVIDASGMVEEIPHFYIFSPNDYTNEIRNYMFKNNMVRT